MYISDKPFRDDSTKLKRSNSEVDTSRRLNISKSNNIKNLPKINEANHRLIRTDRLRHSSYQLSASRYFLYTTKISRTAFFNERWLPL